MQSHSKYLVVNLAQLQVSGIAWHESVSRYLRKRLIGCVQFQKFCRAEAQVHLQYEHQILGQLLDDRDRPQKSVLSQRTVELPHIKFRRRGVDRGQVREELRQVSVQSLGQQ